MKDRVLLVVAHPDDEVLGAGATIHNLASRGIDVFACIANVESSVRSDGDRTISEMKRSHEIIGIKECVVGEFESMAFNTVPHGSLVRFIEQAVKQYKPSILISHHRSDLHDDHRHVSLACDVAARLPQRQIGDSDEIKAYYHLAVPSSTDWGLLCGAQPFLPDTFSDVSADDIEAKIEALAVYSDGNVIRNAPHPRSREKIFANAETYGAEIGCSFAEPFQTVFRRGIA